VTKARSGWPIWKILRVLGLKKATWCAWKKRFMENALEDRKPWSMNLDALLPAERKAIIEYALANPKDGYRRLSYMMLDEDVVYCSPSSVYNVLSEKGLLCRWKPSKRLGILVEKPTRPNQRWHTDIMYLWLSGRWYFFVGILDGYSRYIVHWELLTSMKADDVTLVAQRALEKVSDCRPEIVSDNGKQFTSRDFRALIKHFQLNQIFIRVHHPESNGVMERFHRSLREGLSDKELVDLSRAREIIGRWVDYYNNERLHAGIFYMRPKDYYFGCKDKLLQERKQKLQEARGMRRAVNLQKWANKIILEEQRKRKDLRLEKSLISC
jgi:transposase InsO family protein